MLAPLSPRAELLRRELGLSRTIAEWLVRRGHVDPRGAERFLGPRLAHLSVPDAMADREAVSGRLVQAIRNREKVAVFGDYDCDGITSAAIMTEVIRALGGVAVPLVASRFEGGYGLSGPALRRVLQTGARLLVTCDCGSSDHEALAQLREHGVDAVVIDHHLVPEQPLPVVGFLNPHRKECGFTYKGLASCGLALSVAAALRKGLGADLDLRYWLDLVAIGTIADVAPLDGDNRCLVRAGLEAISKARRPGMLALLEVAKISREVPLTGRDVAFRLAPHINAPGRLGSAEVALELLLARDLAGARVLAARLDEISAQRRQRSDEMLREAEAEISQHGYDRRAALVLGRQGWNAGLVGIVAGRLVDRFAKPVIVIGFDGEVGRGSVRGPAGARLYDALQRVSSLLDRFGGHQAAAGLELRESRLDELRERFAAAIEEQAPASQVVAVEEPLGVHAEDDPKLVLDDLNRLEPCGFQNPRPRLSLACRIVSAREVKNGHLKLLLELGGKRRLSAFAPNRGPLAAQLEAQADTTIRVLGDLRHNDFPGGDPVEMLVEEFQFGALDDGSQRPDSAAVSGASWGADATAV